MAVISLKTFLEAGVHFGHQTRRWHPKMAPYIYGTKNGVHVIDLRQTLSKLREAYEYVKVSASEGKMPLFVGTKTQIQRIVKEEAERCESPYINFRWLGGLLTNFGTVKKDQDWATISVVFDKPVPEIKDLQNAEIIQSSKNTICYLLKEVDLFASTRALYEHYIRL